MSISPSEKVLQVNSIEYCENLRNIDKMLEQFGRDRAKVLNLLVTPNILTKELWSPCSPICKDDKCIFNMGKTMVSVSLDDRINGTIIANEGVVNYYMCSQCKNMSRLIDFNKGGIDKAFYIECGKRRGDQMIVKEDDINNLIMRLTAMPKTVIKVLNSLNTNNNIACTTRDIANYTQIQYLGSDPFTNNMLINYYIQDIMAKQGLPHINYLNISFVCKGKGYNLCDYPDIGTMRHLQEHHHFLVHQAKPSPTAKVAHIEPLSYDIVQGIVYSLFATLHYLQKYDFSHGGPTSKNILFQDQICSYSYDGVDISCPITLKITDFHHSGVTVKNKGGNGLRLYSKSVIADETILSKPFSPVIDTVDITPFRYSNNSNNKCNISSKVTIFRLKNPDNYVSESVLFMYIKHLGLPIYNSSFDCYAWMVILMAEKSFYTTLVNDSNLYKLWRNMWIPSEFETVQDRILDLHKEEDPVNHINKVLRVLAGLGLRCDMVDYAWSTLKSFKQ